MSISVSSAIAKHMTSINGTLSFDNMPNKTKSMIKTYVRTGVSGTAGVASQIAGYVRRSNGLQYISYARYGYLQGWNIHEQAVFDAIVAASTVAKLDTNINRYNDDGPVFWCRIEGEDGRLERMNMEGFIKLKPRRFQVNYAGLEENLVLKKLCDPMEIDTTQPLNIDLLNF